MARALTASMQTAFTETVKRPFLLVHLAFDSGDLRLWTGYGDLSWDGETWTGAGDLLGIGAVEESIEVKAVGTTLELSGVPASLIATALTEDYQGRAAALYFGLFDEDGDVIADPKIWRKGVMDVMEHEEAGDTARFLLSIESGLIALRRAEPRNYTSEDHQIDYSGDVFFEFVPDLQLKEVLWGSGNK